jgi:AmmeMemoRadiSam system protein A
MHPYVDLAKKAVETYIKEKKVIISSSSLYDKDLFNKRAGVFVTIKKNGSLRGCIGTIFPTKENLFEEIVSNAIASATNDYRFEPIKESELESLSYTVYILNRPQMVNNLQELNPKKFGVIIKAVDTDKTGVLLPDLEGVETIEDQLNIALKKAGINPLKEKFVIFKFETEKYE